MDPSARYLVLSDADRQNMVVYVLQLYQDTAGGTAHISSVSEFPLTQPCLSFAILEACTKRFKQSPNDSHLDEITTGKTCTDSHLDEIATGKDCNDFLMVIVERTCDA
jgi:hypothetical protein